MTETVLVAGTASHVGKSTVAAGLCRHLADRGIAVAPFKAQNMSNNARVALRSTGAGDPTGGGPTWGEIGVSQFVQARAAGVTPTTDHNPVLLKPRGGGSSQVIVDGRPVAEASARGYYAEHWETAREAARRAHERVASGASVVVVEGAGSLAEINLHDRDLANVETARFADAHVLLVTDIDRGGAFASLLGTLELLPGDLADRVLGCVMTKFRGDRSILEPGIEQFEERTGVPVLGVVPYEEVGLPQEDSLSLPEPGTRAVRGADDAVAPDRSVTVAVPRLPRLSNATDLEPLVETPGVRVAYVPLDGSLEAADAVVLPGSKNTVDDLLAMWEGGLADALGDFRGPVVGICGGYQMLGERLTNAAVEGTGDNDRLEGLGLLPVRTRFGRAKTVEPVTRQIRGVGPLSGASGSVSGYEIHAGETEVLGAVDRPFPDSGAATDQVLGTYLHGIFENSTARDAFLEAVYETAGRTPPDLDPERADPFDRAAALVASNVDLSVLPVDL